MREPGLTEIPVKPSVFLDMRSEPDVVPFGAFRMAINMEINNQKRLARLPGWRRFDDQDVFTNQDLHLYATAGSPYAFYAPNLVQQFKVGNKQMCFCATQAHIWYKNGTGWDLIHTAEDQNNMTPPWDEAVWTAGAYEQIVVFSNNKEPVIYYIYGQPANSEGKYVETIPDLEELNVTKAALVVSWNNFILLMNVEMDGKRQPNHILWSDYKAPLSYVPSDSSAAGETDLLTGEVILAAKPLKDALLIYTNQSIWECRVTGRDDVFSFTRRHHSVEGAGCLVYKRTLVSTGEDHRWMGRDGYYRYDYYVSAPERVDWMDRATATIYNSLDTTRCNIHCAGFDAGRGQIWISWAKPGETLPSTSLLLGVANPFAAVVDAGFTAFGSLEPKVSQTILDFLAQFDVCPVSGTSPGYIYTAEQMKIDDGTVYEVQVENYLKSTPDANSLYNKLYMKLTDLCAAEDIGRDCSTAPDFVMASARDFTLKELCDDYFRDFYNAGVSTRYGYASLLRSGAIDLNDPRQRKVLHGFFVAAYAELAAVPGSLSLRIGVSSRAVDPNVASDYCQIHWVPGLEVQKLDCLNPMTLEEAEAKGVEPDWTNSWPVWVSGHYLYWELSITNPDALPINTGAAVSFSKFAMDCRRDSTRT